MSGALDAVLCRTIGYLACIQLALKYLKGFYLDVLLIIGIIISIKRLQEYIKNAYAIHTHTHVLFYSRVCENYNKLYDLEK